MCHVNPQLAAFLSEPPFIPLRNDVVVVLRHFNHLGAWRAHDSHSIPTAKTTMPSARSVGNRKRTSVSFETKDLTGRRICDPPSPRLRRDGSAFYCRIGC